jgi:hypothetical protein
MIMEQKELQKNILFTVAYFAAFNYALTIFELWRNLFNRGGKSQNALSYREVLEALDGELLSKILVKRNGFVTLADEEKLIDERLIRQKLSLANIRKSKSWIKIIAHIPYMRGVFLTGTLSMKNAREKSDWDIFVVLAKDRIWLGRLFLVATLQLLGKRRHGKKVSKRFCLNHYVTERGLILEEHNEFCSNFVSFSFPVFGQQLHKKYIGMNEQWIRHLKPNFDKEEVLNQTTEIKESFAWVKIGCEKFLETTGLAKMMNSWAKKIMTEKIKNNPATYYENADIRCTDSALVFLPNPHRIEMLEKTFKKLTNCV